MKKKLENLVGEDKIRGKPIRLNRQRLKVNKKGYAELLFLGDVHHGHPNCNIEKVKENINYCIKNKVYVILMGDLLEAGTRTSVGDSVYMQSLNPQEQHDEIEDIMRPLAEAGLVVGCHIGNHEARILKDTSVNLTKMLCKTLKMPYLGSASWSIFYVGNQSYTVYSMHGTTGSKFIYTKIKALIDISHNFHADIMAMGHTHDIADEVTYVQLPERKTKKIVEHKKYHILTGHYLGYDGSYAQDKGFSIGKIGSPKVKLFGDKKDIHSSD